MDCATSGTPGCGADMAEQQSVESGAEQGEAKEVEVLILAASARFGQQNGAGHASEVGPKVRAVSAARRR